MSYDLDDTICAIGTASGGAARGMVRVSGPNALAIVERLFRADDGLPCDRSRQAIAIAGRVSIARTIATVSETSPSTDGVVRPTVELPCDLFVWPTSRSYTREPVAELHTLGSPPLLEALLAAVCSAGARLAEPGEFTMRAFLAGRLDLTQAEAVLGVIDARGQDELDVALSQLAGGLARPLQRLREDLLQLLAELEAGLDFVEEDIEFVPRAEVAERLQSAVRSVGQVAKQMASRSTATATPHVALIGRPNVGKSSLFNALVARRGTPAGSGQAQRSQALVSPRRGTTRDYLTATIDLGGMHCELEDTAGVDEASTDKSDSISLDDGQPSMIDAAARALSRERLSQAAIRVRCIEAGDDGNRAAVGNALLDIVAITKADLGRPEAEFVAVLSRHVPVVVTSSRTGEGVDELCATCRQLLMHEAAAQHGQLVATTANRCRESIRLAELALRRANELATAEGGDELVTAELRSALSELGKVVGAVYTDDLLDRIFSSFCIGK
jgi:tRNA modification GTPase